MITITREHEIACGHRVYGHESKCAHLHGHNYRFEIVCTAPDLDALGRVVDFSVIKAVCCEYLETAWDHKMLLHTEDPLADALEQLGEPVVRLSINPTAENIARLAGTTFDHLFQCQRVPVRCVGVTVWETGKCAATWTAPFTIGGVPL